MPPMTTPALLTAERLAELRAKLRSDDQLPFCPYDRRSPDYHSAPDDAPCPVCRSINEVGAPDFCNGTGSRIMREAADALEALLADRERLEAERDALIAKADMAVFGVSEASAVYAPGEHENALRRAFEHGAAYVSTGLLPTAGCSHGWRHLHQVETENRRLKEEAQIAELKAQIESLGQSMRMYARYSEIHAQQAEDNMARAQAAEARIAALERNAASADNKLKYIENLSFGATNINLEEWDHWRTLVCNLATNARTALAARDGARP